MKCTVLIYFFVQMAKAIIEPANIAHYLTIDLVCKKINLKKQVTPIMVVIPS